MQNFKEHYLSMVDSFKEKDSLYYKEFLAFCGKGNILDFSVYNQMAIYDKDCKAEELHEYNAWVKLGRMPKKGTGIQVMNREQKTGFVFDRKHTFPLNKENVYHGIKLPGGFSDYKITENMMAVHIVHDFINTKAYELIARNLVSDSLKEKDIQAFFIDSCGYILSGMQNKKWEASQNYDTVYEKIASNKDCLFVWFQPYINKVAREIKKQIIREVEHEQTTEHEMENEDRPVHPEQLSNAISDAGVKRSAGDNIKREGNESSIFTEEYFSKFTKTESEDWNFADDSSREDRGRKDFKSGPSNIALPNQKHLKNPTYVYFRYFDDQDVQCSGIQEAKEKNIERLSKDKNCVLLGCFPNNDIASDALMFYRSLSDELKNQLGYAIKKEEITQEKRAYVRNKFEKDFHEYYQSKQKMKVQHPLYEGLFDKAEGRELYDFEAAVAYMMQTIDGIPSITKCYLNDLFQADISIQEKESFLVESGLLNAVGHGHYTYRMDIKYTDNHIILEFNPYAVTGNSKTCTQIHMEVPILNFVILLDKMFSYKDYAPDLTGNTYSVPGVMQSVVKAFDKFAKEKNITYEKVPVMTVKSKTVSLDKTPYKIWSPVNRLTWWEKLSFLQMYQNDNKTYDDIINAIDTQFKLKNEKTFISTKEKTAYIGCEHQKDFEEFYWYDGKQACKTKITWAEMEHEIGNLIENGSLITENDIAQKEAYMKEGLEKTENLLEKGLNPECIKILEKSIANGGTLSTKDAGELTLMRLLVNSNHERYRIFLKEVFSQKNLSIEKQKEFLLTFNRFVYKFWGTCTERIWSVEKEGMKIFNTVNPFYPGEMESSRLPKTYEKFHTIDLDRLIEIIKGTVLQESFIVPERDPSPMGGRLPEGTMEFYNKFKEENNFDVMFDTSKMLDDPWVVELRRREEAAKKVKTDTKRLHEPVDVEINTYEQLDLFSFATATETNDVKEKKRARAIS